MKKLTIPILPLLGFVLFFCTSYQEAERWIPVFMERNELERSVSFDSKGREMQNPGKIYVRGTEIFVNEKYKGVHIIENSDPFKPYLKAFIVAPGCIDMAVKGDVIYLDNAIDLVAFDLSSKTVTERIRNLLPEHRSPDGNIFWAPDRPEGYILVGWKTIHDND